MARVFLDQLWRLSLDIAPLLLLGLIVAGILHVLVSERAVLRHLGRPGWWTVVKATLLAIPLPLCSCSVVPVVASLRRKGATNGASVSFLIAAPQIGADSFLLTQGLLGPLFALFRIAASAVTALVAGVALDRTAQPSGQAVPQLLESPGIVWRTAPLAFWRHVRELTGSLANNLLIGLAVAALILVLLPEGWLDSWQGRNPLFSMFPMLLIGLPVYICATAATPIAAALVMKGLHPGAALVFLLAGPATNMVTLVLLRSTLGWRSLAVYIASIAGVSLLAGWLLGEFWTGSALPAAHSHAHGHEISWLTGAGWLAMVLLLAWHYVDKLGATFRQGGPDAALPSAEDLSLSVAGMTCTHCAGRVDLALRDTGLVADLSVDLASGSVRVWPRIGVDRTTLLPQLRLAVREAGYDAPED
jgi:hypothetical protein